MKKLLILSLISSVIITSCSTAEEKATLESKNQAIADSIINAASSDSAGVPVELSPEAEDKH
jgi:uncharacterized protein YcfL